MLQVFLACCHEGGIVGSLFLHVPEVAHALYAFAVSIASDGSSIGNQAHIEALATVQGLQDDGRSALNCELAQFVELLAEIVARVHRMGAAGLLTVEGRHHDDATRVNLAGSLNDFAHRAVESVLLSVLCKNESVETCTYGSHANITSLEGIVYLVHATSQTASAYFETCYAQTLAVVKFFLKRVANGDAFLKAEIEWCGGFLVLRLWSAGSQHCGWSQRRSRSTSHGT